MPPNLLSRRLVLLAATASLHAAAQIPDASQGRPGDGREDHDNDRLPNGRSQQMAIAKENHQKALADAESLIKMAQQLQDELKRSGEFVVPLGSVRRTEEIEKLARRIRGRLRS